MLIELKYPRSQRISLQSVDYKKGALDPGQFVISIRGILPELEIEALKNLDMLKAELDKAKSIQN